LTDLCSSAMLAPMSEPTNATTQPLDSFGRMLITQQNRPIRIHFADKKPELLLYEFEIREELGRPYEIMVKMQGAEAGGPVSGSDVLGKEAMIRMETEDPRYPRYFNGFVSEFEQIGPRAVNGYYEYHAKMVPKLALLKLKSDCRAFRNKTAKQIFLKIIKEEEGIEVEYVDRMEDYDFDSDPTGYCIQYRESTFDFVSRLMEHAGVYYFFRHDPVADSDKAVTTLVACMRSDAHDFFRLKSDPPCVACHRGTISKENPCTCEVKFESYAFNPNAVTAGTFQEWRSKQKLCSEFITLDDYDYTRPREREKLRRSAGSVLNNYTLYDYPAGFSVGLAQPSQVTEKLLDHYVESRLAQHHTDKNIRTGLGSIRTMGAGYKFTFTEDKKSYLTTSMELLFRIPKYSGAVADDMTEIIRCRFRAMELGGFGNDYQVPMTTPKPRIHGVQTAVVVAPDGQDSKTPYTDELGRVLIRFHWDRENRSKVDQGNEANKSYVWVRVSQISAGNGWGSMFLPRPGNEVIVAFEDGDPDRPLIVGCVYNQMNKPMINPKDHSRKSYICDDGNIENGEGSGNAICFSPDGGKESITIFSQSVVLYSPFEQLGISPLLKLAGKKGTTNIIGKKY
jgi:type VI secretion system secreted protein VgrG